MKIAFFGTPDFAGKILSGILEYSEIECVLVVSQPDKSVGRKRELSPTPVKQVAIDSGIEVIQPEKLGPSLNSLPKGEMWSQDVLQNLDLDFIVVVAYGKIIPQAILDIPKYGCINIHGSILPKYRGASPVQSAIKDGLSETGLTTMFMSAGMDEGDILKIAKVEIDKVDTSEDIFKKFVHIGPELLVNTLTDIISGSLKGTPQDHNDATHCGKISREDGEVFFQNQTSQEVYNKFRAYTPWPGIYTWFEGKRLVLEGVSLYVPEALTPTLSQGEKEQAPELQDIMQPSSPFGRGDSEVREGQFIKLSKNRYGIICADKKILEIHRVKLEGKKSMDVASFVNGNREVVGYCF